MSKLEEIEQFASAQMSVDEIATITSVPIELIVKSGTKENEAFLIGRLRTKADIHASIVKLAKQGSSPAQKELLQIMKETAKSDIRHKIKV